MNAYKSIAALACAALCAYSVAVNAAEQEQPAMQHYVFKYDFSKKVHPMVVLMQQTSQQIQYEVALDIVTTAHAALYETYDALNSAVAKNNDHQSNNNDIAE